MFSSIASGVSALFAVGAFYALSLLVMRLCSINKHRRELAIDLFAAFLLTLGWLGWIALVCWGLGDW